MQQNNEFYIYASVETLHVAHAFSFQAFEQCLKINCSTIPKSCGVLNRSFWEMKLRLLLAEISYFRNEIFEI